MLWIFTLTINRKELSSEVTTTDLAYKYNTHALCGDRGSTVVKVLCYKSEGRWFDSRWCHWKFSSHYGPGVVSASNRNEHQEYFLRVKVAGA
jgi:hypothetical protein